MKASDQNGKKSEETKIFKIKGISRCQCLRALMDNIGHPVKEMPIKMHLLYADMMRFSNYHSQITTANGEGGDAPEPIGARQKFKSAVWSADGEVSQLLFVSYSVFSSRFSSDVKNP